MAVKGMLGVSASSTAFVQACKWGHLDVVRELLSLGGDRRVDVHAEDRQGPEAPLRAACLMGRLDVVRELLSLEGDRAFSPDTIQQVVPEAMLQKLQWSQ